MPKTQTELFNQITRQVKHMMTTEGTNWLKPWTSGATNALTGKRYRGINCLFLSSCTHWATYKQWQELGCQVRKGQKATTGLLFKPVTWSKETEGDTETGVYFMLKEFKVFSAAQVDGFEQPTSTKSEFERHAEADQFIANTGATIVTGSAAAYHPSRDFISMPAAASFIDTETSTAQQSYYSTMFHELAHWTGHASRLDRLTSTRFGSHDYAKEELVAELAAAMVCGHLGLSAEPRADHARYLNAWLEALDDNPKYFAQACGRAARACDYLIELQDSAQLPVAA